MKKEPNQQKPNDETDQPTRTYEKPLTLAPLTFIQAVRKLAKAKPANRKGKTKTKPA